MVPEGVGAGGEEEFGGEGFEFGVAEAVVDVELEGVVGVGELVRRNIRERARLAVRVKHKVHDEIGCPVRHDAKIKYTRDVRMLNAREGAAFGKESLAQKCGVAVFKDECLQRIARPEREMLNLIHLAHSADADAPDDAVAADCGIRKQSL